MNAHEFMRLVDAISRERGLDKQMILDDIEKALNQAATKRFDQKGEFTLTVDRTTGEIRAFEDERPVPLEALGRIVANVAKQVIGQRLREAERDLLHDEFVKREGTIVSGAIQRIERGMVLVSLGRAEAILPREEQIPGEIYRPGATIRALLMTVGKKGQRVRLVLSRTHVDFVRGLFATEIPEVAENLIEIRHIVREAGRRTKIAVYSADGRIDPVGACVGMRGSRISKVADELGGEKIDIIPWAEDPAQFIINSLKPAGILRVSYDVFRDRAKVVVSTDQLPLAIGKHGQNVRLASRLTRYKIDVASEEQVRDARIKAAEAMMPLMAAGLIDEFMREVLLDLHLDSLAVLAAQTPETLLENITELPLDRTRAEALVAKANELLNDEQKAERDDLIRQRLEAEARSRAEAASQAAAAASAATEAQLAGDTEPSTMSP